MDEVCDQCGNCLKTCAVFCTTCKVVPYCSGTCLENAKENHSKDGSCKSFDLVEKDIQNALEFYGLTQIQVWSGVPIMFLPGPITLVKTDGEKIPFALRNKMNDKTIQEIFNTIYGGGGVNGESTKMAATWSHFCYYCIKVKDLHRVTFCQLSERQRTEMQNVLVKQTEEMLKLKSLVIMQ